MSSDDPRSRRVGAISRASRVVPGRMPKRAEVAPTPHNTADSLPAQLRGDPRTPSERVAQRKLLDERSLAALGEASRGDGVGSGASARPSDGEQGRSLERAADPRGDTSREEELLQLLETLPGAQAPAKKEEDPETLRQQVLNGRGLRLGTRG